MSINVTTKTFRMILSIGMVGCGLALSKPHMTPIRKLVVPTVALLPVVDLTTGTMDDLKVKLKIAAAEEAAKDFSDHAFPVVAANEIDDSIKTLGINLNDEAAQKADSITKIVQNTKADFAYFVVLTDFHLRKTRTLVSMVNEAKVSIKVWLLDVKKQVLVLDGKPFQGVSRSRFGMLITKGEDCATSAIKLGVDTSLKDFLATYPQVKNVKKDVE